MKKNVTIIGIGLIASAGVVYKFVKGKNKKQENSVETIKEFKNRKYTLLCEIKELEREMHKTESALEETNKELKKIKEPA